MFDVITMGSAVVDTFAKTKSQLVKILTNTGETDLLAFQSGSKLLIDHLEYNVGGGGTNTALAFKKLGMNVAFLGKVGKEFNGHRVIEALKKEKVNVSLIKKGNKPTGISLILDEIHENDRVILTYKGINNFLTKKDITLNKLKTKWIYSSSLIGQSFKTLEWVSDYAKKKGIKFAFNPSLYQVEKGISKLKKILKNTNVLLFNLEEASTLTKEMDVKKNFEILHSLGPEIVVITDGKKGAYISDSEYCYELGTIPGKPVDTTGAGDAFSSSFITGLIKKNDIEFAIKLGQINAHNVVMHVGARKGLLSWNQVLKQMKDYKIKIKKVKL